MHAGVEGIKSVRQVIGGHQVSQGWAPFVPEGPRRVGRHEDTVEVTDEKWGSRQSCNGLSNFIPKEIVPVHHVVGTGGGVDMEEGDRRESDKLCKAWGEVRIGRGVEINQGGMERRVL